MDERARRVGANEAVFREVNERLRGLNEAFGSITNTFDVVCECGDGGCTEHILMMRSEYEDLRADPALFAIVRGHEIPDFEDVVERGDRYDVVRKRPGPARNLAEVTDPRG